MSRRGGERAVTIQIGAVLLLAIFVTALAVYQVNAVPEQNYETEFAHNERITGEVIELRDAIRMTGADRTDRAVSLTLGTQYQTRVATINPPSPAGRLETSEPLPVAFSNASVEDEAVQQIIDDPPETRLLTYEPGYNEYDGPTTVVEHTMLYDAFEDGSVTLEEQTAVRDGRLTLVFLDGDLSRYASGTVSVTVESLAGPTRPTTLESDGSGNVTLTLPSKTPERWADALGTSFEEDSGATFARVSATSETDVTIELADRPFDLQLAQVSVGSGATADERLESASEPEPVTPGPGDGDDGDESDETFDDGTVYATGATELEMNEQIDYSFVLETTDHSYDVRVWITDFSGHWGPISVTIDGEWFTLSPEAADDIAHNLVPRDLFDEATYAGGNGSLLESIQREIDDESTIVDEVNAGDVELDVDVGEQ